MQVTTKWADYVIVAVRYDPDRTHITHVQLHRDDGRSLGPQQLWTRNQVIDAIQHHMTFATAFTYVGVHFKDEDVRLVRVGDSSYLRTDAKRTAQDDFGRAQEFMNLPAHYHHQRAG